MVATAINPERQELLGKVADLLDSGGAPHYLMILIDHDGDDGLNFTTCANIAPESMVYVCECMLKDAKLAALAATASEDVAH